MKSKISNLLRNNVGKILGAFIFAFMCCGVMLPMHAFAITESISGSLTLELVSSGGGGDVPGGDSAVIDASTSSPTGAFNFLPIILGILAVGLIVLLVYLYKTGKLKNKTLSIFALCLVVSVGFCGAKSIIANAADVNDLKADNISSSAYLKFDETGKVLENNFEIINNTSDTINIENVTSDSEYSSILPELKGTKVESNSTFAAKLKCESIPEFAVEKVKEKQGKIEVDDFYNVEFTKAFPSDVKVSINMPSKDGAFVGDVLSVNLENFPSDATARIEWYKVDKDGNKSLVGEGEKYTVAEDFAGSCIVAEVSDITGTYTTSVSSDKVAVYKGRLSDDTSVEITLPQAGKEIIAGDKLSVKLTNFPSDATAKVEWYRVDKDGKETLASEGEEYTVTSEDAGCNMIVKLSDSAVLYYGNVKSSNEILVHKQFAGDVKATITTSAEVILSGETLKVGLDKFPTDATAKYTWYRVDGSGAETSIGEGDSYTAVDADGGCNIKVKVSDSAGLYVASVDSSEVLVHKIFPEDTSIEITLPQAGKEIVAGDKLGADLKKFPTDGTSKIEWYRVDKEEKETLVGDSNEYTVSGDDVGCNLWVRVSDTKNIYISYVECVSPVFVYKTFPDDMTIKVNDSDADVTVEAGAELTFTISNPPTGVTTTNKWYKTDSGQTTEISSEEKYTVQDTDEGASIFVKVFDSSGLYTGKESKNKAEVEVSGEAYAYKDGTTLIFAYDKNKEEHPAADTYSLPANPATQASDWGWDGDRSTFTKVKIDEKFQKYKGLKSTAYMFYNFTGVTSHEGYENLNTSNVENMSHMFCSYGTSTNKLEQPPNVSRWNTSNVKDMSYMFNNYGCSNFDYYMRMTLPNISNWDTSKVTDLSYMLANYCGWYSTSGYYNLLNLSNFNTKNVSNCQSFLKDTKVKSITLGANFNLDLSLAGAGLTNSNKTQDATWYDKDGGVFAKCGMGTIERTEVTTYYDTNQSTAYGYMDTSKEGEKALVLTYDGRKKEHKTAGETVYENIPTAATQEGDWPWYENREEFTKVQINENFKNYSGLTSTLLMFFQFKNANAITGAEYINTQNVTDMGRMFEEFGLSSTTINEVPNVSNWDTQKVTSTWGMFFSYGWGSTELNTVPDVSKWDTQAATLTAYMFCNYGHSSTKLNTAPNFSSWTTSSVTNMKGMFQNYGKSSVITKLDLSNFNTSSVEESVQMLENMNLKSIKISPEFTLNLGVVGLTNSEGSTTAKWFDENNTELVTGLLPVGGDISEVTTYFDHFHDVAYGYKEVTTDEGTGVTTTALVLTYDQKKAEHVEKQETVYAIPKAAESQDEWGWHNDRALFTKVKINENFKAYDDLTSTAWMFTQFTGVQTTDGFENLNTSNVTMMARMFAGFGSETISTVPNVSNWDTSKTIYMTFMFGGYGSASASLNVVPDVSKWNTSNVISTTRMFDSYGAGSTVLNVVPDVYKWDTSQLTETERMFNDYASSSTVIDKAPDFSNWNTQQLKSVNTMFQNYGKSSVITKLDLSRFKTSNVTESSDMLKNMKLKSITISPTFTLKLSDIVLTNSTGSTSDNWYDEDAKTYAPADLPVGDKITKVTTYYDHDPSEPYGYLDTSTEGVKNLVVTFDTKKSSHGHDVYLFPTEVKEQASWGWYGIRDQITKVTIDASFKNYTGLTSTKYMFYEFKNVTSHEGFENIKTANVTDMAQMFFSYASETKDFNIVPNVENWDTSKVENMFGLFGGYANTSTTISLVPNVSNWVTTSLTNIAGMFGDYGSKSSFECLDLSSFDTSKITSLSKDIWALAGMKLKSIKISPTFTLKLSEIGLTNSNGTTASTDIWYDENNTEIALSDLPVGDKLSDVTTYYDHFHDVAYGYKEATTDEGTGVTTTALVLTYDQKKAEHVEKQETVYDIPKAATEPDSWGWKDEDRDSFTKVKINENFKNYDGLTSTASMFCQFKKIIEHSGFENLNVSNVTNMDSMFWGYGQEITAFNLVPNVSGWNTSKVENMSNMFCGYGYNSTELSLIPDVSTWNTSKVTDMSYMFTKYGRLSNFEKLDLSNFNTSNVTKSAQMLDGMKLKSIRISPTFTLKLSDIVLTNSTGSTSDSWYDENDKTYIPADLPVGKQITKATTYYDTKHEAYGYKDTTSEEGQTILVITYDRKKTSHSPAYNIPTAATQASDWGWNADRALFTKVKINDNFKNYTVLTSTAYMFSNFSKVATISGLPYLKVSNVTNMQSMFLNSSSLVSCDFPYHWDASNATDMSYMFKGCTILKLDCSEWAVLAYNNHEGFNDGAPGVKDPWSNSQNESGSLATSQLNENNSMSDNAINNQKATKDKNSTDALSPDSQQDKSSTEADTKDKASGKTSDEVDTQQADTKAEEAEPVLTGLVNFTSSITPFFNSLRLPFV